MVWSGNLIITVPCVCVCALLRVAFLWTFALREVLISFISNFKIRPNIPATKLSQTLKETCVAEWILKVYHYVTTTPLYVLFSSSDIAVFFSPFKITLITKMLYKQNIFCITALWQGRLWPVSNTSACMQGKCTVMFLQGKLTLQREKEREGDGVVRCLNSPRLMFLICNCKRWKSFHDKSLRLSALPLSCGSWALWVLRDAASTLD